MERYDIVIEQNRRENTECIRRFGFRPKQCGLGRHRFSGLPRACRPIVDNAQESMGARSPSDLSKGVHNLESGPNQLSVVVTPFVSGSYAFVAIGQYEGRYR